MATEDTEHAKEHRRDAEIQIYSLSGKQTLGFHHGYSQTHISPLYFGFKNVSLANTMKGTKLWSKRYKIFTLLTAETRTARLETRVLPNKDLRHIFRPPVPMAARYASVPPELPIRFAFPYSDTEENELLCLCTEIDAPLKHHMRLPRWIRLWVFLIKWAWAIPEFSDWRDDS